MKKIICILCFSFILIFFLQAQGKTITIYPDQFGKQQQIQLAKLDGWIFQEGSDKTWSQPDIDLAGWKPMKPVHLIANFEDDNGRVEGWFRVKFKLSQAFDSIPLSLDKELWPALDVYLDGELIHAFGKTGTYKSEFEHYNPNHKTPFPVELQADREYLLAIHFVNYSGIFTPRNLKLKEENLANFINFAAPHYTELKTNYHKSSIIHSTLWVSISTFFMILFWLMYLQNPEEKVFMLIAFLSFANFLTIVGTSLPHFFDISFTQEKVGNLVRVFSGGLGNVLMLMVGEWIFKQKNSILSKTLLVMLPIASVIANLYNISAPFGVLNAILNVYFIYLIITNWNRETKVQWAVVIAMFIFLASISVYIVLAKKSLDFLFLYGNMWLTISLFIPLISLLIYVSLRFREIFQDRIDIQLEKTKQLEAINVASAKIAEMQRVHDLDEIKSKFFANISHEFRTPLSLILGPLQQVAKAGVDNKYILDDTSYNILTRNAHRLQNLVDQLLDLSKLESGHVHLSLDQGNLIQFLRSIVFSFESMAERNGINFITNFPLEIELAFYDKDKLEKIISNLITNAIKYTPSSGSVTVTAEEKGGFLLIEVTDTGKGIKNKDIRRIFERFYRVEGSEEKGSGIGLALTKELVELHNGQVNVSSTKGEGTTFKVRLPFTLEGLPNNIHVINNDEIFVNNELVSSSHPDEERLIERKELGENNAHDEKHLVLIVEDNKDLRTYISSIVSKKYKTLLAKDGDQGERLAFEHIPDVIISDVMMPKKDGYALCNSLKNNQKTSHIPIIMLTAKAGFDHRMEGLSQGADAYLTKPFKNGELMLRLQNMIESRQKMWHQFQSLDLSLLKDMNLQSVDDQFVQEVMHSIRENLDNEQFGVEDIARAVRFSRSQLHRKLKAVLNKSCNQLIVEVRMKEAKHMLELRTGNVSEVAYSVGYSNLPYFTKSFKKQFGVLPSKIIEKSQP